MSAAELWIIVATVLFVALVFRPVKKTVASGLDTRRNKIVHDLDEAARLRAEAEALLAEATHSHASAAEEAARIVAAAQSETNRMRHQAEAEMKQSIARRERQASDRIAQAEANAIAEIKARAVDLALEATSQLLTEKLAGEAGDRLLDEAIAALPASFKN